MWSHSYSVTTEANQEVIWRLIADVNNWRQWNDGIESIELNGPLKIGATYRMTPPGENAITSTVVALEPGKLLTDRTEMDELVITVEHRLTLTADRKTTVTFHISVTGPVSNDLTREVGLGISADFPEVLAKLVALAEARDQ